MKKNLLLLSLLVSSQLVAKSNTEALGDILAAAIPLTAYGTTLIKSDTEGQYQFYKSYGATMATTYALKYTVKEKRPDSNNEDSFPSGHTASAFAGASFIHQRYGLKYAVLPYLAAAYTGYSRVHSNKHFTRDVVAGAALATLSSWYFVEPYKNLKIAPTANAQSSGVTISYRF